MDIEWFMIINSITILLLCYVINRSYKSKSNPDYERLSEQVINSYYKLVDSKSDIIEMTNLNWRVIEVNNIKIYLPVITFKIKKVKVLL